MDGGIGTGTGEETAGIGAETGPGAGIGAETGPGAGIGGSDRGVV